MAGARITGLESVFTMFGKATTQVGGKLQDQIRGSAEMIYRRSQVLVPKDTHALARSGRIKVWGTGINAKASVEYGGIGAPYALWVHEDLQAYHKPPTSAKYLSKAVHDMRTRGAAERRVGGRNLRITVGRFIDGEKVFAR